MKLSLCCTLLFGLLVSHVRADTDYFTSPAEGSTFAKGDTVQFHLNKMPEDDEIIIFAKLLKHNDAQPVPAQNVIAKHKGSGDGDGDGDDDDDDEDDEDDGDDDNEDGEDSNAVYVATIQSWLGSSIGDGNSGFSFSWTVDNVTTGAYHVELETKPYKEGVPIPEGPTDQDDLLRSRTFRIVDPSTVPAAQAPPAVTPQQPNEAPPTAAAVAGGKTDPADCMTNDPSTKTATPPAAHAGPSPGVTDNTVVQRRAKRRSFERRRLHL